MRIAVIDIGSNTIKLAIYETSDNRPGLRDIYFKTENTGLLNYLENGELSRKGIRVLSDTITDLASEAGRHSCFYVFPFATASLRKASNHSEVIDRIKEKTGLDIDLLDGEKEAGYSFDGLASSLGNDMTKNGIVIDMGGGSTEIITYSDRELKKSVSFDFGVLSLYNSFVTNIIPSEKECARISRSVRKTCGGFKMLSDAAPTIYLNGGTGKAIVQLHSKLEQKPYVLPYMLDRSALQELIVKLSSKTDNSAKIAAIKVIPSRIHTVVPGLCAILELMSAVGAERLTVTNASVREGYALRIAARNPGDADD